MKVYKNYSLDQLDNQYNNRAAVGNFAEIVKGWEKDSKCIRQKNKMAQDLAYGKHERERLDIIPASCPAAPVLVFFHGGYWQAMTKEVFHFIAGGFLNYGITLVFVNYPLEKDIPKQFVIGTKQSAGELKMILRRVVE